MYPCLSRESLQGDETAGIGEEELGGDGSCTEVRKVRDLGSILLKMKYSLQRQNQGRFLERSTILRSQKGTEVEKSVVECWNLDGPLEA